MRQTDFPVESTEKIGRPSIYVNESGMYALIFGSKKDEARRFKHWVTSEVLPGLRAGKYGDAGKAEYDVEFGKLLAHLNTPRDFKGI